MFVIYFRDLPESVDGSCDLYADDTMLYDINDGTVQSLPDCCHLPADLAKVVSWANRWNTIFNVQKSAELVISRHHRRDHAAAQPLSMSSGVVPHVDTVNHLGITISSSLSWSAHIQALHRKVGFNIYILKRLAGRVGSAFFIARMYLALVRPVLEYGCVVWDSCLKAEAVSLERLQLAVARATLRVSRRSLSNHVVLAQLGWPTLAWRRRRFKLLYLWKLLHGEGPPMLAKRVPQSAAARSERCLRNSLSLAFPLCNSSWRLKTFLPSSIALWNTLPVSVSSTSSASSFLRHLDVFLAADKFTFGLP